MAQHALQDREHNVLFLDKENQINRVIRDQRKSGEKIRILFTSLWDGWSSNLLDSLKSYRKEAKLYVINSFTMPHSFVIFNSTMLPQYVNIRKSRVFAEDYLPLVYKSLGLE